LLKESSAASQDQIREFVAGIQAENLKVVKSYFQMNSTEQKKYVEGLLVDFSKYLQQQRNDDLQVVQTQLKSLQQNTDLFKQETEQILTSIISTVGPGKPTGTRN
jgi:ribosomal protein L15E